MDELIAHLGWLLSPTRKIIDLLKRGDRVHRGNALRRWSFSLFWIEVLSSIALALQGTRTTPYTLTVVGGSLILYAYSRINEIAYAFYSDALSQAKESDLKVVDRIRMAMRSYFGLAFNFALLYYFLPTDGLFKEPFKSFSESFYFSGVTLATLGYGDIYPTHALSRLLALYEVFTGILIIAVAIATYVGGIGGEKDI